MEITHDQDRVILRARNTRIPIPYGTASTIAAHLSVTAKRLMQLAGEDRSKWRDYAEVEPFAEVPQLNSTGPGQVFKPRRFEWRIAIKDNEENLYLFFGNIGLKIHFSDAIQLSQQMRAHAKYAKAWAGDDSRKLTATGYLSDAEQDYKLGL